MQTEVLSAPSPGLTEEQRREILEQMNRLLEAHEFKNSRRYPQLLRFIVEETLEGRGDLLKERLLGIRVFNRPADYDTAADPIVRVTIAEIRKRIAQYYHDEDHDAEIRIELMPGRYAPEFRLRREVRSDRSGGVDHVEAETTPDSSVLAPLSIPTGAKGRLSGLRRTASLWAIGVAVIVAAGCGLAVNWLRPTALDQFWGPLLEPKLEVLFCIPTEIRRGGAVPLRVPGTLDSKRADVGPASGTTFLDHEWIGENVVYSDMLATLRIANVLTAHHRDYGVRLNVFTSLDDLRHGPAILIGGLDNQWTMRTLAPLPYHFAGSDADRFWIEDSKNPGDRSWSLDLKQQYVAVTRDYALIARLHNEQTGEPEIVVAGIGMSGTAAAGEFVAEEQRMVELRRRIGPGFKDHDFEVVLSTDVVNGVAGSPKILAISVW